MGPCAPAPGACSIGTKGCFATIQLPVGFGTATPSVESNDIRVTPARRENASTMGACVCGSYAIIIDPASTSTYKVICWFFKGVCYGRIVVDSALVIRLLAAAVVALAAAWMLYLRPSSALHRATALLLWVWALVHALAAPPVAIGSLFDRLYIHAVLALPFAAANLTIVHRHAFAYRRGAPPTRARVWRAAVAGVWALLEGGLMWSGYPISTIETGFGDAAVMASFAAMALLAWGQMREALATAGNFSRFGPYALALGLVLEPAGEAVRSVGGWIAHGPSLKLGWPLVVESLAVLNLVAVAAVCVWASTMIRSDRRASVVFAAVLGAFVALAIVRTAWNPAWAVAGVTAYGIQTAHVVASQLVAIILLVYAILRYRLFGIELHFKGALQSGLIAAPLTTAFFVLSEVLEQSFSVSSGAAAIIVAAAIAVALRPLQWLVQRFVERLLPGVAKTPDYLERRRDELYAAAVEHALIDGRVTDAERAILNGLQSQLGIPPAHANVLETRVTRRPPLA